MFLKILDKKEVENNIKMKNYKLITLSNLFLKFFKTFFKVF